jgi:hypothetical protein
VTCEFALAEDMVIPLLLSAEPSLFAVSICVVMSNRDETFRVGLRSLFLFYVVPWRVVREA